MCLGGFTRALIIPLALVLYGSLLIAIQPLLIRLLTHLMVLGSNSLAIQALSFILYIALNALLLYTWFRLTRFARSSGLKA